MGTPKYKNQLEKISFAIIRWTGTPWAILVHTLIFASFFGFIFLGVDSDSIMLILTTAVSLEAIYLSLFIQMSVNKNTESLSEVEEDLDKTQEDVEDIEGALITVASSVKEIEEDVEDISEDVDEDGDETTRLKKQVDALSNDIAIIKEAVLQLKNSSTRLSS
jgi:septal ring factor EnvC (AmiA/AmiB activator)